MLMMLAATLSYEARVEEELHVVASHDFWRVQSKDVVNTSLRGQLAYAGRNQQC